MTTSELTSALEKFRSGKVRIMVATNVAEMGLDISSCSLVINYDRHMDAVSKVQSEGEYLDFYVRYFKDNIGSCIHVPEC